MSTDKTLDTKPATKNKAKIYKFDDIEYTKDVRDEELHLVTKKGLFTEALVKHKLLKKYNELENFRKQWAEKSLTSVEDYMNDSTNVVDDSVKAIYVHQEDLHESSLIGIKKDEDGEFYVEYVEETHKRNIQPSLGGLAACTMTWLDDTSDDDKKGEPSE